MAPLFFCPDDTKIFTEGNRDHRDSVSSVFFCLIKGEEYFLIKSCLPLCYVLSAPDGSAQAFRRDLISDISGVRNPKHEPKD